MCSMGGPDVPRGRGNFYGKNVADHCKVLGHSTVSCAKTAEPIDMPFWMKAQVGRRNCVLHGGADPPRGMGNFRAIQKHWQSSLQQSLPRSLQKGLFNCQKRHAAKGSFSVPGKRK